MPIPELEHMLVAQKASSEVLAAIMRTSFEGMQRLAELNMAAAKEVMSNSATSANTLTARLLRVAPPLQRPHYAALPTIKRLISTPCNRPSRVVSASSMSGCKSWSNWALSKS